MKKIIFLIILFLNLKFTYSYSNNELYEKIDLFGEVLEKIKKDYVDDVNESKICLLYTSPSPRDRQKSRMPSSA